MIKMKASLLLKIILTLCVFTQCMATFPHHHHHGMVGVCVNLFDCDQVHAECLDPQGNCCAQATDNNTSSADDSLCELRQMVISQPQREVASIDDIYPQPTHHGCFCTSPLCAEHDFAFHDSTIALRAEHQNPQVEALFLNYITLALPVRAPALLA